MSVRLWKSAFAAAAIVASAAVAQQNKPSNANDPKSRVVEQMLDLAERIDQARTSGAPARAIQALIEEYQVLSLAMGGDDPAHLGLGLPQGSNAAASQAQASAVGGAQFATAPACGAAMTTTNFAGSGAGSAITGGTLPLSTIETVSVSGLGTYIWDVNFNLNLPHTFASDLDITLTSPAGTVVTITTDNGSGNDNVYAGTLFDDSTQPATSTVTDYTYTNLVTATPLAPEGRLMNFRGEDPNGTWTLKVTDDAGGDVGNLNSWSVDITTLAAAPTETTTNFTQSPALAIVDNAVTTDSQTVTTTDTYLSNLSVYVEITHTECADLDIRLISPAGTTVALTTDNGSTNDNVFNGTLFSNDAVTAVTDAVYANLVVQPLLSPEGGLEAFVGQDPNGLWTLSITDDLATDVGTLVRWDLNVTTASAAPTPSAPSNFGQASGALIQSGSVNLPPLVVTSSVSGMGAYLWDVDLNTNMSHTSGGDFDITLTSPAGTVVTVTTDNGGTFDNVFAGTLWDDNTTDACTDHVYANLTAASPISPEGRFSAFRGEDPNGTWTLSIGDDATADNGTLNSWSLDVTTIAAAPSPVSTTISNTTPVAILDVTVNTDTMVVSGLGTSIANIKLFTQIQHTWASDMDITLTSPAGTVVVVTTDNGGSSDDVWNGTSWDPDSTITPTDYVYTNLVVVPVMAPEGAFDNFIGQDPNGNWVLTITDDLGGDFGTLNGWSLTIDTCGAAGPVSYCTAGTSSNGCQATLSSTNLSASFASACVLTASNVEGVKSGLLFYSISGQNSALWCATGTSFLCVKSPTQRTPSQNSGGTVGLCDGTLTLDVNNYLQVVNPTALGTPFAAGNVIQWQGWYRDPPACKTTQLTDGLEMTVQP